MKTYLRIESIFVSNCLKITPSMHKIKVLIDQSYIECTFEIIEHHQLTLSIKFQTRPQVIGSIQIA